MSGRNLKKMREVNAEVPERSKLKKASAILKNRNF